MGAVAAKRVSELGLCTKSGHDAVIHGLTLDSRAVQPGWLFAALPGAKVHGATFISKALEQGAAAYRDLHAGTVTGRAVVVP